MAEKRMNSKIIRRYYILALFSIALIMSVGQLVVYYSLSTQASDAALLNLAGRQRMYSQMLSKDLFLLAEIQSHKEFNNVSKNFVLKADTFFTIHRALRKERLFQNIRMNGTRETRTLLKEADKYISVMSNITDSIRFINQRGLLKGNFTTLNRYKKQFAETSFLFLPIMEQVVYHFQNKANAKLERTRMVSILILVIVLVLIFAEGFLLFRPMLDKLDKTLLFLEDANRKNKEKNAALLNANQALIQNEALLEERHDELKMLNKTLTSYSNRLKESNKALEGANSSLMEKEQQLNDQNTTLSDLNHTLTLYSEKLQMSNLELERFAYIVSHDLKAPLRAISNLSIWIEEDLEGQMTESIRKNFELLRNRVARLEALINGVLAYSRATRQNPETASVTFQFGKAARDAVNQLVNRDEVSIEILGEEIELFGEPIKFEQILGNLLSNAIKHNNKPNPEIKMIARKTGNHWAEVRIMDNGPGIPKEYFDKIFEMFQTLKSRDVAESTGVGLAIVKKIIEEVNGSIHVESEEGNGSSFLFTWPLNANQNA